MRVIAYIRVSTEQQAETGVSLEAQEAKLRAYALALDLELVEVVIDAGVSAKTLERPGLKRALLALENGQADGLLIAKLDRLTRSVRDLGELVERYFAERFALLSVGDSIDTRSAAGRLVLHVLGAVSQWEREAIAERTTEALAHLKKQGVRLGASPLGMAKTERIDAHGRKESVAVCGELETVARIRELHANGHTLRSIAQVLTAEGRATKKGGAWAPKTVRSVLLRTEIEAA